MSKDFDDILKEINKNNKELHNMDNGISKDMSSIKTDIFTLKKELKTLSNKIDLILDILNNLSIMVLEEEEDPDILEDFDSDQTWVPEEDEWNNHEDES